MDTSEIRRLHEAHLINLFGARRLAIVRGKGVTLWDADGREYLDFFAGVAVANLGHCHPEVTRAIQEQADTLVHISNLYYIEPQAKLAALLTEHSFADNWYFCNSGAEANEAAIKLARRYWYQKGTPRPTIITALGSFHGRTLATLSASGQTKIQEGFEPLMPGFTHVPYDDVAALRDAITDDVGAIMLEPVQGENGVRIPSDTYLADVRKLCDEYGILLILDEVQTGMGRTGKLFAHQHSGIHPDIMTLAKGLGNGAPIGALGCTRDTAQAFTVGSHGGTFGGNPLCTAAAFATLRTITSGDVLEHAAETSAYLVERLERLVTKHSVVVELRAKGLMIGLELAKPIGPLITALAERGVICGPAGPNVLRMLPPLIITQSHVDTLARELDDALGQF